MNNVEIVSGEAIIHLKEEAYFLKKQRDNYTVQEHARTHAHKNCGESNRGFFHKK